jgi:RimJ/RimL family protein N-acetyltransferase
VTEIETAQLLLRAWSVKDLNPYARVCADPEVMRYLSGTMSPQQTEEEVSRFMRHWEERGFRLWAVEEKASGLFIGFIGLLYQEEWPVGDIRRRLAGVWTALSGGGAWLPKVRGRSCTTVSTS